MPSNSLKLVVFLFIILVSCFFNFPTTEAKEEEVSDFAGYCLENVTTMVNTFQANLKTLFSSLSSNATVRPFYNDTVGGGNTSDTVYGLFMCRGDVPSQLCEQCVRNATQTLSSRCYLSKRAMIWGRYCMVRYSNTSFFSILDTSFKTVSINIANASNQARFKPLLADTMNKTADEVAAFSAPTSGSRYFATKEASISENQTLYCLAQCTQDLSPQDCRTCLTSNIAEIPKCCEGRISVAIISYSCIVLSEMFPFYYRLNAAPGQGGLLLPQTKNSRRAINSSSLDPDSYLSHHCPNNGTLYDYSARTLKTLLLSYLSSNATAIHDGSDNGFYKTDVDGTVFGLFMCRADIPPRLCGQCVVNATHLLASECPSSVEAIVFYNHCLVRYSNNPFFSTVSTIPRFNNLNVTEVKDVESSFKFTTLSNVLGDVVGETAYRSFGKYWWTESFVLNDYQTIYVLAQCTRDLSRDDCYGCLYDIMGSGIPWSKLGSVGGSVVYPSCTLRFELFRFYSENHSPPLSFSPIIPPSPPSKGRKGLSRAIISSVIPIVISVILFSFCCYYIRKQARKSHKNILKEYFGPESTTVESLQFDLAIIKIATNNFSYENRIGRGGFGEVYKGIFFDGRHIAVKRLSSSSKQGVAEFKNEVLLIAKLQHRNLVAFIGFCLEEQEKILIYEYVPNKSLDYFLFDPHSKKLLNWAERYKIIEGIARGILYLHEYSRLKIIHRDIKPSNILLDENMNPKVSDFGLARIVEMDQQQRSTNKIAGTLGYMPPEYTLQGQFSEKLDVFSFGVMVLEIITGKKNVTSYKSHRVADDGLLNLVWRQYRDQTPLSILDLKLKEDYSEFEVTRCIQIGLLCVQEDPTDRPTMINIVSYLSNPLFELPIPQEPVFFLHRKMDQEIVAWESRLSSVNVMSTSSFDPR